MPENIQPIKRSTYLAPLSREHHEGLLLAWKIRQGLKKEIDRNRIKAYSAWFFDHHLSDHFLKEETEFKNILEPQHPMLLRMVADHQDIRNRIDELNRTDNPDAETLEALANLVTTHIRFEERQLFAEIEKRATPEQLEKVATDLPGKPIIPWRDEFWLHTA